MTDQTNPLTPKQTDREAAAEIFASLKHWPSDGVRFVPDIIRRGNADDQPFVQILANHAQQARLEEREIAARVCDQIADGWDLRRKGPGVLFPRYVLDLYF